MQSTLQGPVVRFAIFLVFTGPTFATGAWSQCNNPSSPGVVICTPTTGSTVVYLNEVSVRSTPAQGATITGFTIDDNGKPIYQSGPGESGIDLYDGSMYNGKHNLVVTATDTEGNTYQAKTSFTVTGLGYPPCPIPKSPGVVICAPPAGAIYSTNVTVETAAKGQAAIRNIAVFLNGKFITNTANNPTLGIALQLVGGQGASNVVTITATDADGNQYSANKTLAASYTFGLYSCFYTCTPGISAIMPQDEAYVGNSFTLDMQIVDNPRPITSMKAYIDNSLVAMSSGSTLQQEVSGAPNGTHILTVEGWDSEGVEYRIQQNLNINVVE